MRKSKERKSKEFKQEWLEEIEAGVLNRIRNSATSENPIKLKALLQEFNLDRRQMSKVLFDLRQEYPIVARDSRNAGYWIADDQEEVERFANLLKAKIKGHKRTLDLMKEFLD